MRALDNSEPNLVAGGDLDGNAGEKEAKAYMEQQTSTRTIEYCEPMFGTFTGLEVCYSIRIKKEQ
jgi:hypothetical protein